MTGGLFAQVSLTVTMSSTPACSLDGSATATVTNGTPPYTYSWWGPTGQITNNTATLTGIPGGSYYVSIVDMNQWYGWGQVTVTPPFNIAVSSTNDMCGTAIGTATANVVSGGTPPFTYVWSNGMTGISISGLLQGAYEVTVTDANGCFVASNQDSSLTAWVYNASPITYNVTTTGSTCSDGTASIANLTGGTPPYSYVWSTTPPQFTATATGLAGYTYGTVSVTDAAGCMTPNSFWINQLPNGLSVTVGVTPETCIQANGTATASISGGTAPYTYAWSNGATTQTTTGLSYGYYTVTVTDINGCPAFGSGYVHRTDPLTLTTNTTYTNCANLGGGASVSVVGGTPPYTYLWSTGATTSSLSGIGAGYYHVSVTDANGCYDHAYATVQVPANCYANLSGYVLGDLNNNCVNDVSDFPFSQRVISIGGYYGFTNASGFYSQNVIPGNYVVQQPNPPSMFAQTCPVSPNTYTVNNVVAQQQVTNLDFFNYATSNVNDLVISMYAQPARPTAPQTVTIYWANRGTTVQNAVINYTHDPLMSLFNGGWNMTSYNLGTRTVTYNLGPVYPGQTGSVTSQFTIPNTTPLGTTYSQSAEILPISGDAVPQDNQTMSSGTVVASYDPNDKSVLPAGLLALSDTVLTYTIRFQNTGNDTAFTVAIRDTIDTNLDIFTLEVLGASHNYALEAEAPGVVIFKFENIMLPDSNINEPASHGHIIYRIRLKDNLPLGTEIRNTAAIYFDFNSPVITNTTLNTFGSVAVEPGVDGAPSFLLFPNPATAKVGIRLGDSWDGETAVAVRDLSGRVVYQSTIDPAQGRTMELQLQQLPKGVYLVECMSANTRMVRKLVLQ